MIPDSVLQEIGVYLVGRIKARTRLGYVANTMGGRRQRLKPLAPLTIALRQSMALSPLTRAATSNLTMTGQMLDSLGFDTTPRTGRVELSMNNNFALYKAVSVTQGGRPFMNLTRSELDGVGQVLQANTAILFSRLSLDTNLSRILTSIGSTP